MILIESGRCTCYFDDVERGLTYVNEKDDPRKTQ
jgi:hypothetical protein